MRKNLPVTEIEYLITDETLIVSKTDLKGKLTYFNEQFVEASGFTSDELMGQPHNIVRHPDMPAEAFDDLWETLRSGKPWAGAVKNRRKNGDFYWVLASATPIWEGGHVVGYMSIRSKLADDQREAAERVYAAVREKKAQNYRIEAGNIRRKSLLDAFAPFRKSFRARLVTLVGVLSLAIVLVDAVGLVGFNQANLHTKSIYEDRSIPLAQLFEINDKMRENTLTLFDAAARGRSGRPAEDPAARIQSNIERISTVWAEYMATYLTPEEKIAADRFASKRTSYVGSLRAAVVMESQRRFEDLDMQLVETATAFAATKSDLDRLVDIQVKEAKVEFEAAESVYRSSIVIALGALIAGLLVGGMLAFRTIRAIGRPLTQLNEIMSKIAQGIFNTRVEVERDDEAGIALRNLQALQSKLGFDRESQQDMQKKSEERRKEDMHRLASEFETAVGEIVETVAAAATELEASAGTLTRTAGSTKEMSVAVAAASEEASTNVHSVASATEEMASSVHEISRRVQDSAKLAADAVDQARQSNERVRRLSAAANRIGDVVDLINSIAGQPNLLALNATIEAARAGDAGRGFAVVASEVKALAEQTAKATGEIGQQVSGIQIATVESADQIEKIGLTIVSLAEISAAVAAAVEEQGAATQEISRNVQQGASETGAASSQVLSSATSLSTESSRLKAEVARFLAGVRAA
jgi:aerotaxis receptor